MKSKVVGGSEEPTVVPLTPGEIIAIGNLESCSGTLIAANWVVAATHCPLTLDSQFCMGTAPDMPNVCFAASRLVKHDDMDVTLIELDEDPRMRLPEVVPLQIMTEIMDCTWLGRMAEAAGYGLTATGIIGTRNFIAEPIVEFTSKFVTIDGQRRTGLCRGDSGGPLLIEADDGTVRVAGTLSRGDVSCRGLDHFTRMDRVRDWIELYAEP